ncbi:phage portal protein [Variovorax sp. RCC_210]|uniref:phage portal protein n=1 Tax=Variovorax sp. RCC_210 TaxID=3239217 RepID=UPI00352372AB
MNAVATWDAVQSRAASPGSSILNAWRAEREATRAAPRNDVTDSKQVISGDNASMLQLFGVNSAAAGVAVTPESAMRVSAVFACVQRIAGAVASLPIETYQRVEGERERVENAPLWWLLNEQPTPRFTAASHWEHTLASMLLRESGFTYIRRNRMGEIKEFVPLPWDGVSPRRVTTADSDRLEYSINDVRTWGCDQDDMLHFPGFGFNGLRGMSVIQWAARNAAGTAMAMDEYSGRFFAGGAHPSIVLSTDKQMTDKLKTDTRESFAARYSGVENAHRLPLVLTEGMKVANLSLSAEDSQLLEARKFQVIDIARAFGVPPHMIGETSASTSWGSGIEAMSRAFVTYTLETHLQRIEQELNRKLFRTSKFFMRFDRDALLESDSDGQAKYFRAGIGGPGAGPGWMSIDEVRKKKNLKPMGGKSAEVYFPPDKAPTNPTEGTKP